MVEQGWLACTNPAAMLSHITGGKREAQDVSHRKLRLFAAAACRLVWDKMTDASARHAVVVAEDFSDGVTSMEVRSRARRMCWTVSGWCNALGKSVLDKNAIAAAEGVFLSGRQIGTPENAAHVKIAQAGLLREIFGNPWRPAILTPEEPSNTFAAIDVLFDAARHKERQYMERWCLTPQVVDLARAAYQIRDRHCQACGGVGEMYYPEPFTPSFRYADGPVSIASVAGTIERKTCRTCHGTRRNETGHLDPVRLAILADALEESGCQNEEILDHLRSRGPHVRGCWVIDLILGKI